MPTDGGSPHDYVNRVRQETQQYIKDLINENQRLKSLADRLNEERSKLTEEKGSLESRITLLEQRLDSLEHTRNELRKQLNEAEELNQQFSSRYVEVEQHNNNLANLYVASYRLHETVDHEEILKVLQEILINLVGSEEFAILERPHGTETLDLVSSYGVDASRVDNLDLEEGPAADALEGKLFLADSPNDGEMVACVPLRVGGRIHGLIAIFGLLSHKAALEPLDYELFDLLASHAGTSLYLSQLHGAHSMA